MKVETFTIRVIMSIAGMHINNSSFEPLISINVKAVKG